MSGTVGLDTNNTNKRELFNTVYATLSPGEQAAIDVILAEWSNRFPKMGKATAKELFVAIALYLAGEVNR